MCLNSTVNYKFETENIDSYEISPQIDLERRGVGDGYYFMEVAKMIFRCKIGGVLDGYLDINLKENVSISSISYDQQMHLRDEFEIQHKFVAARSFIEKIGFHDLDSDSFYSPDQFEFDFASRTICFIDTRLELDISSVDIDRQKSLVYGTELESLGHRVNSFLDSSVDFFGLIYDYNVYLKVKSELTDLFVSLVELCDFYPLDETITCVRDYFTQILILFKFPKPKVTDFLSVICEFKEGLKDYRLSNSVFSKDIIQQIRNIRSLRSYLLVVSRFSNFGDRYNFHALMEFFNFLIFYAKLAETDLKTAKKLAQFNFEKKFKLYLIVYLDSKRVMKLLSQGDRISVTNEINLIEKILEHSDLMDYNFVSDLKERVMALKMAFHLYK